MQELLLSRGLVALVDDADYPLVSQFKWSAFGSKHIYAGRNQWQFGKSKTVLLHRFIMDAPDGVFIDHIDNDGLNCQRSNLRLCSRLENNRNKPAYSNNTSGYKGVTFEKDSGKWIAQTKVHMRHVEIGRFYSAEEAARAYDAKVQLLFGEFARLNFPICPQEAK